jgi:hypothetical protein
VNADTSDHGCAVNDSDALVRFCSGNGPLLSRWTAADNDKIVFGYAHFRTSIRSDIRAGSASIAFFLNA